MNIVCLVFLVGIQQLHIIHFNRYKFECWDIGKKCHQITSKYDYPKLTNITITYDKTNKSIMYVSRRRKSR